MRNRFYFKISISFLGVLLLLGLSYILITTFVAQQYIQESNQKLYGTIADTATVQLKKLIDEEGNIDEPKVQDLMHSLMVINPNLEVYLLDKEGNIETHVAPYKRVKLKSVQLEPIIDFINSDKQTFIKGDDPRCPGYETVFSAAEIKDDGQLTGYLYIVLMSEEQAMVTSSLFNSYILKTSAQMFFITLLLAFIFGSISIWYLTKNLSNIIEKVRHFKEGDLQARIENPNDSDLSVLSNTFNEMADTIVANIEQLKSVEQLRRELIANVSHDLRTPLAIMQGYVETLLIKDETVSSEDRVKYLKTTLNSSKKLEKLIKQLFEYSQLEAKQIEPVKEPFFLSELAQDVFQKYQILAKEKAITISLDVPEHLPMVFADVGLVDRVIQNLLDNALKFTPNDGNISIGLQNLGDDVEIRISDTGSGMSVEEQAHIFERYNKVNAPENAQGAGLGLAIVKKILELHNATIEVQSKLHQGTSFMFQLPILKPA